MRVAVNVFVVARSAPASKYASWISEIVSGRGEVEDVRVALDVVRVVAEALAAVLLLGELAAVDEDAPRPVEDEDPLGEGLLDLSAYVLHAVPPKQRLPPREVGSRKAREAL